MARTQETKSKKYFRMGDHPSNLQSEEFHLRLTNHTRRILDARADQLKISRALYVSGLIEDDYKRSTGDFSQPEPSMSNALSAVERLEGLIGEYLQQIRWVKMVIKGTEMFRNDDLDTKARKIQELLDKELNRKADRVMRGVAKP